MKWILFVISLTLSFSTLANEKISSINFIQEGDISKFIIKLSGSALVEKKHIKEDKMILLDIKNVSALKKVLRPIDTSEFKSSVTYISGYQSPTNKSDIRFTINLRDNVRSKVEYKNNNIVVSLENRFGVFDKMASKDNKNKITGKYVDEAGNPLDPELINIPKSDSISDIIANIVKSGPKKYIGKKISLNVRNMPVTELLQILSEVSGFNIIVNKDVQKVSDLTLNMVDVPWDEVLDTVLGLSKLVAEKHSNILVVDTLSNATKQKEEELKEKLLSQKQEPLVTKVFPISYAKLEDLVKILQGYITEKRGSVTSDERTNNVIVQDTVEVIERIKRVVELLDTQTPQVLIEAKVVEAEENYGKKIGLREDGLQLGFNLGDASAPNFTISSAPGVDTATAGATMTADNGGVGFSPFSLARLAFNLELMEYNSEVKIISSPRVITENKKVAKISTGETRRIQVQVPNATGAQTNEVEEIEANLTLEVTPNITNDGSIAMNVKISKAGFADGTDGINTNTRLVETNVLVDNGSTVVLGGVYSTEERKSQSGIPLLKDLPLLGWLFRTSYNPSTEKKELIVFITPRIINQEEAGLTGRLQNLEDEKSVKE